MDNPPQTQDLGDVAITFDGYWVWVRSKRKTTRSDSGKYLFFSEDPSRLREIALAEIRGHGFHTAKYNLTPVGAGTERVLCLFYEDDSRKSELADRAKEYRVKYRYWKSDFATLRGEYSRQFLETLSPEDRERFTEDKVERKAQDTMPVRRTGSSNASGRSRAGRRSSKRSKAPR
jgi:hypothetical protein